MHDPTAPDSPHLTGAQPTWGDLPYACELIVEYWEAKDLAPNEVAECLESQGEPNKVRQLLTLFSWEKLGILTETDGLAPNGIWLAYNFEPPTQQGLDGTAGLGSKQTLSPTEQALFQMLLFKRNWLPMLATINQLATEAVSRGETDRRAGDFRNRVGHLKGYQQVESINSWKKKAQAHFKWARYLDLAYENPQDQLELTGFGQQLHEHLYQHYHPEWP